MRDTAFLVLRIYLCSINHDPINIPAFLLKCFTDDCRFDPEIRLSQEDYAALTDDGLLCNEKGEIGSCELVFFFMRRSLHC